MTSVAANKKIRIVRPMDISPPYISARAITQTRGLQFGRDYQRMLVIELVQYAENCDPVK